MLVSNEELTESLRMYDDRKTVRHKTRLTSGGAKGDEGTDILSWRTFFLMRKQREAANFDQYTPL